MPKGAFSFGTGAVEGTGLGLTIARAHGGEIRLEDSSLRGLRARLRLPV
jgi:two-component system osmolarity sensor histidine kinase EnvZ